MTAAPIILPALILHKSGVISMPRPQQVFSFLIITAARGGVGNQQAKRRARGAPIEKTADNLNFIWLLPRRGNRAHRPALGQPMANTVQIEPQPGLQAVNHHANRRTMALAKQ